MSKQPEHVTLGIRILGGVVIAAIVFLGGVYVGYENRPSMQKITGLLHKDTRIEDTTDFSPFWTAWETISEKFPGADTIDAQTRLYGAIKGLAASFGDPYTTFFPPEENEIFETEISGSFSGIGAEIGEKEGILTVIAPLKGTPAERAGVKSGDKIIKIDETMTAEMSVDKAITLIRGEPATKVALTIMREGLDAPKVITITRERITLPTVETKRYESQKVFAIELYNFSAEAPQAFVKAFNEYLQSGYTNLLLDLRGNPGGYLDAADTIAGYFIPRGQVVVKEIGKTPEDVVVHTSDGPGVFPKEHKLVILVDEGSASASEILAGALSEHGIGTLAGQVTFGKGSVQEVVKLTKDTSLKVTVAKWYTPNGVSISDHGLTPEVLIEQPENATEDIQLQKALALFKK